MMIRSILSFACLPLISIVALGPSSQPHAQGLTLVSIYPALLQVEQGINATVAVQVSQVSNLYGFEILLNYDPSLVKVTQVSQGSFLDPGFTTRDDPQSGETHVAVTEIYPSQPKSGDGPLLVITLQGLNPGSTSLNLSSALLADENGVSIPTGVQSGQVVIIPGANLTPSMASPIATLTLSYTPRPSPTQAPLLTLTASLNAAPTQPSTTQAAEATEFFGHPHPSANLTFDAPARIFPASHSLDILITHLCCLFFVGGERRSHPNHLAPGGYRFRIWLDYSGQPGAAGVGGCFPGVVISSPGQPP